MCFDTTIMLSVANITLIFLISKDPLHISWMFIKDCQMILIFVHKKFGVYATFVDWFPERCFFFVFLIKWMKNTCIVTNNFENRPF